MGEIVFHRVKGVYTSKFKTKKGAIRFAKKKYPTKEIGIPFRWGNGWEVYVRNIRRK